eukprot:scaffold16083_cov77-Skeletonema_marinoi.AAC.3
MGKKWTPGPSPPAPSAALTIPSGHLKGEYKCAFKYVKSRLHRNGLGVAKDEKKELHHFERAAILCGNPDARHNLGCIQSVDSLKKGLKAGIVGKEDLASTTLRAHLAAVGAMKSYHRDK